MHQLERYDLIGIGFGPANLSVSIALEEANAQGANIKACFLERKPEFEWHGGMLLDGTRMQISFLKDLVSLRNPCSSYSFINYLHENERLSAFINMSTFQPTRLEFNDYLTWAAKRSPAEVHYGSEVETLEPFEDENDQSQWVRIGAKDHNGNISYRLARNIIVAVGGTPNVPDIFHANRDVESLTHSSGYKMWRDAFVSQKHNPRIGIVGAGQSAAEIFVDLVGRHGDGHIEMINRERSIHPADDSPFVNEIFDPNFTNEIYQSDVDTRKHLCQRFLGTNYAVVDMPEIESIYETLYTQKIKGIDNHKHLPSHQIEDAVLNGDGSWTLSLRDQISQHVSEHHYDGIVLATGYRYQRHFDMIESLSPWFSGAPVERNYRLPTKDDCSVNIYLQGCNESSHGLSDTLLSVLAVRSKEITDDLINH